MDNNINKDDFNIYMYNNNKDKIFSVTKLNLIKNFYHKHKNKKKNKSDDFFFDDVEEKIQINLPYKQSKTLIKNDHVEKTNLMSKIPRVSNLKIHPLTNLDHKNSNSTLFDLLGNDVKLKTSKIPKIYLDNYFSQNNNNFNSDNLSNRRKSFENQNNIDKVEIENSSCERLNDMKKVKKLDEWDKKKLRKNFKNSLSNKDLESLNRMNEIRDSLSRINKKNMSNLLNDFYKKNEIEQGTILMSNINLGKKSFNFEIFNKINNNHKINIIDDNFNNKFSNNQVFKMGTPPNLLSSEVEENMNVDENLSVLQFKENISLNKKINFFDNKRFNNDLKKRKEEDFFRSNDIKIDGDIESLSNIDVYRKVIKEKLGVEKTYRKELLNVAQEIHKKKTQKEKLNKECIQQGNYLQKMRNDFREKKEILEAHKRDSEKLIGSKLNFMNSNTSSIEYSQISGKDSMAKIRKEERIQQIFENQKLIQAKDLELVTLSKDYETAKSKYLLSIQDKRISMNSLEDELKDLKSIMNNLLEDQRKYYLDILKKGIDVRREGLCWVVKKLIELNTIIDDSIFPRFLDTSQIQYIMKVSYKQIESYQLKLIFEALKDRQTKINEEKDERNDSTPKYHRKSISCQLNKIPNIEKDITSSIKFYGSKFFTMSFSEKLRNVFESIVKNNEKLKKFNRNIQNNFDDIEILNVISDLKRILLNKDDEDSVCKGEILLNYFKSEKKNTKEYFKEKIIIRDNIIMMQGEIRDLIEDYKKNFKKKNLTWKSANNKTIQYDLLFSALFGNGIII